MQMGSYTFITDPQEFLVRVKCERPNSWARQRIFLWLQQLATIDLKAFSDSLDLICSCVMIQVIGTRQLKG